MKRFSHTRSISTSPRLYLQVPSKPSRIVSPCINQSATPQQQAYIERVLERISVSPNRGRPMSIVLNKPVIKLRIKSLSQEIKNEDMRDGFLEEMTEVRKNPQRRLKQTLEDFSKLNTEPQERLTWKDMLKTGQYIGTRKPVKKDEPISGRAVHKEKVFKDIRQQVMGLKYERKNHKRVVKHLTTKEQVNPTLLAQPLVTATDSKLGRSEAFRILHSARQSMTTFDEIKGQKTLLAFDGMHSPKLEHGKEQMRSFNQEQLKKLKGGLNYINKWLLRYKNRDVPPHTEESSQEYKQFEGNRIQADPSSKEENQNEMKILQKSSSIYLENEILRRKMLTTKQVIEERIIDLNPQNEFLKRLGLSEGFAQQEMAKSSFFLTSEDVAGSKSTNEAQRNKEIIYVPTSPGATLNKIDLTQRYAEAFFNTPKFRNTSPPGISSNGPSYNQNRIRTPRDAIYAQEGDRRNPPSVENSPRVFYRTHSENRARWRTIKKSLMPRETAREARSPRLMEKLDNEKDEMFDKYNKISQDCQDVERTSKGIRNVFDKNAEVLEEELGRMGDVPVGDRAIDERLKREIKEQIVSSHVVNPHFGKILMRRFSVNMVMK